MRKSAYGSKTSQCVLPSDSHRSIVTLCWPTVSTVPAGIVPAGAFLWGRAADPARDEAGFDGIDRLPRDALCEA